MSFLANLRKIFTKSFANPVIFGFFSSQNKPMMGEKQQLLAYKSWVFACTNAIAERVADIEIFLEKKSSDGSYSKVNEHESLDVLHHVNDFMTFSQLVFNCAAYQELNGNSFWYVVRNNQKKIAEIWPLDPTRTEIVKSETNFIDGYIYTNEKGEQVPLGINEIIHFKRFNSKNTYRGMGTVEAAAVAIDTDDFAGQWQRNFFGNSAIPAALLTSDGTLNQDQYDRIKANWDAKYKGVENASKLAILEGNVKYQTVTNTPQEMQFSESRKDLRDEIMAIFRVPKTILGITEDVNFASAQATEYVFAKYVIKPKMKQFIGSLNEEYLPLFGLDPYEYRFNFIDPVPENIDQKLNENKAAVNVWRTINEVRASEGLDPISGGDKLYVTTLQQPISRENVTNDSKSKKILHKAVTAARNKFVQEEILKQIKVYKKLNDDLKQRLFTNLKAKGVKRAIKKEASDDLVKIIFQNYKDWIGLLFAATESGMKKVLENSGKTAIVEVNANVDFDLQNPRAVNYLQNHALEHTNSYSGTMKDDIAATITEGVAEGQSVDEIATNLGAWFDGESDYRAERLARTETIDAYAQGNLEGYRQSGVVSGTEWLPDAQACDICVENADAGFVALDDVYPSGDDAPPAHPNCECALQPITSDEES